MKPIIAVTPSYSYDNNCISINYDYLKAVESSGGLPIILSYTNHNDFIQLLHLIDGILFSGGGDIDPLLFGEEAIKESGEICPLRDTFEIELCKAALKQNMPLLGICRGIQILCAASGGSIYQDISQQGSRNKHMQQAPRFYPTHTIKINQSTKLHSILQCDTLTINSFHHQSIKKAGKEFQISAVSPDGVIEAIEHIKNDYAIGVQWHPESMVTQNRKQKLLMDSFIFASKNKRKD